MSKRWLVERKTDVFDDVGADYLQIKDGALWFYNRPLDPTTSCAVIYASGQWITVVPEADDL